MHSQARRGDAESPPQSALEFLRGSVGAVQAGGGSRRSRFEREVEALRLWSAEADRCLSSSIRGVFSSEGAVQLASLQPWIKLDAEHPVPDQGDVDDYFRNIGFMRSLHATVPVYYHAELDLAVLDAHPQNILRDERGRLVPIDVVVGTPGKAVRAIFGIG